MTENRSPPPPRPTRAADKPPRTQADVDLRTARPPARAQALLRPLAKASRLGLERMAAIRAWGHAAPDAEAGGRLPPLLTTFLLFVLAPTLALAGYFGLIAGDQYTAEMRFAVRAVESDRQSAAPAGGGASVNTPLAGAATGFNFIAPSQSAYLVTSYVRSRAAVDELSKTIDLRAIFRRPEADFWARLKRGASIDQLTHYWLNMVDATVDTMSGIVTVRVNTFRPEDSLEVATLLMRQSENLVNRISDRARREATAVAENEVRASFSKVQDTYRALNTFRDAVAFIDPNQTNAEIVKLMAGVVVERLRIENEIFVSSRSLSADAPSLKILQTQRASLDKQIEDLQKKLTGGQPGAVATALAQFQELDLQRQLAERLYALAQTDLERARLRAERQDIFFSVFVPPALPEYAYFPRRVASVVLSFIALTVFWSIGMLILASIDDHRI